ncbi:hypothetical protein ABKN59_004053 [Abortiporus biennis]
MDPVQPVLRSRPWNLQVGIRRMNYDSDLQPFFFLFHPSQLCTPPPQAHTRNHAELLDSKRSREGALPTVTRSNRINVFIV